MRAPDLLAKAAELMLERGRTYDEEGGERSMGKTVAAFNAITGRDLTEAEGWPCGLGHAQRGQHQCREHVFDLGKVIERCQGRYRFSSAHGRPDAAALVLLDELYDVVLIVVRFKRSHQNTFGFIRLGGFLM